MAGADRRGGAALEGRRLPDRPAAGAAGAGRGARRRRGLDDFERDIQRLRAWRRRPRSSRPTWRARPRSATPATSRPRSSRSSRGRGRCGSPARAVPALAPGGLDRRAVRQSRPRGFARRRPRAGARYNPLVIVGGAGAGKTHLLHALGNALCRAVRRPVACLSAPEYSGELIAAIDRDAVGIWRSRYRRVSRSSSTTCT